MTKAAPSRRASFCVAGLVLSLLVPGVVSAAPAIVAPPARGQQALAVEVRPSTDGARGGLVVRACPDASCSAQGGTLLTAADFHNLLPLMKPRVVRLVGGRHVVVVEADAETGRYVVVLAAPLATATARVPRVVWRGWTGTARGVAGERTETTLDEVATPAGTRLTLRTRREDVSVCGRPTESGTVELDGESLELRLSSMAETLSSAERDEATNVVAERAPEGPPAFRLLRARASGGSPGHARLTDGDLGSTWREELPGDGRFEFVTMAAPRRVGITAVDLVIHPSGDAPAPGAGPSTLFLATPDRLYRVTMPEDGWQHPGQAYRVPFPEPLHTDCLAVVLDRAHGPSSGEVALTLAEVSARTALDGKTPDELALSLAKRGTEAEAAADILARGGAAEVQAAMRVYEGLDPTGRDLARRAIDSTGCEVKAPFFAGVFISTKDEAEYARAIDRMARCRVESAAALRAHVTGDAERATVRAAEALALLAPADAIGVLLDRMSGADDGVRRQLRSALAHASSKRQAREVLVRELAQDALDGRSLVVQIDLLRALGPGIAELPEGRAAFGRVAERDASFRTRYLMLGPTAELARAGDEAAIRRLRTAIQADESPHVRARAARVAAVVPGLAPVLVTAIEDEAVRVREAALLALVEASALGSVPPSPAERLAVARLGTDPWTFNRVAAVGLLRALPVSKRVDAALAASLDDASPHVRAEVVRALGARKARTYLETIRDIMDDKAELGVVRAAAIEALASMCDAESVDAWTTFAIRAALPLSDDDRRLGVAAITALARVHPPDLRERLAPMLDRRVAPEIAGVVRAALKSQGECR